MHDRFSYSKIIHANNTTGNLNLQNRNVVMDLDHKRGGNEILITHDMHTAACADTVYRLEDGVLAEK